MFDYALGKKLRFSFKSLRDGYVYPEWKTKDNLKGTFYEDAVVVRSRAIVLGDGLGGSKGYSGFFSHYHCLQISDFLQTLTLSIKNTEVVKKQVVEWVKQNNSQLAKIKTSSNAATTLVYLYLSNEVLYTGVAGDSGYSILRFNSKEKKLMLKFRSEEQIISFNTPECINNTGFTKLHPSQHEVDEGDVVFVASDGVLDVLHYSFIIAASNHLVRKMVTAFVAGGTLDDNSYDLADLLESFIANLHKVTVKYINDILKAIRDELTAEHMKSLEKYKTSFFWNLITCNSAEKKEKKKHKEKLEFYKNFKVSKPLTIEKTKDILKDIYNNEICNNFFPFLYSSESINTLLNQKCFENVSTVKSTSNDKEGKFNCETLEELTYPLTPSRNNPHDFKECVLKAIPQLPAGTTIEKITKSFNSRYFARNIGLAAKFMSKDERLKIDVFQLKEIIDFKNTNREKTAYQINKELISKMTWKAKVDDISVASAVLVDRETFSNEIMTVEIEKENRKNSFQYAQSILERLKKLQSPANPANILI